MSDLYRDEARDSISQYGGTQVPEPGLFTGFTEWAPKLAARGGMATLRGMDLLGSIPAITKDYFKGGTEEQDKYFALHDFRYNQVIDQLTPGPKDVGIAGQVVGGLAGVMPQLLINWPTGLASMHLGAAEDLVREGVPAGRANTVGAIDALLMGLGMKLPMGNTLLQRIGTGAGTNVALGMAQRGASGMILQGTPAEGQYKAFDLAPTMIDLVMGMHFGAFAHLFNDPAAKSVSQEFKAMYDWAQSLKPSEVAALATIRQAQHSNVDSTPGKPIDPTDVEAHVNRLKAAVGMLAKDEPVNVENMPAGKFTPDPVKDAENAQTTTQMVQSAEAVRAEEGIREPTIPDYLRTTEAQRATYESLQQLPREEQAAGVGQIIEAQLRHAGLPEHEAIADGKLWETLAQSASDLHGIAPADILTKYRLHVSRGTDRMEGALEQTHPEIGPEKTINVDGVERPTTNSEGRPIASSPEGVKAFYQWFGDSKVVDEKGQPRVGYKAMQGEVAHIVADTGMTHVALDPAVAAAFGEGRDVRQVYVRAIKPFDFRDRADLGWLMNEITSEEGVAKYTKQYEELIGPIGFDLDAGYIGAGLEEGLYQTYEMPLVVAAIRARGYDAVYMVEDQSGYRNPNIAVFDQAQIKSAIGNRGTFDANDPNILHQSVSTRVPTGKREVEDHAGGALQIGLEVFKKAERAFKTAVELLGGYVNWKPNPQLRGPEARAEKFIGDVVKNLLWLHDKVPEEVRARSKLWYEGANRISHRLADKYGTTDAQSAAVIAVNSPQTPWFPNVSRAERVMDIWHTKQDAPWTKEMDSEAKKVLEKPQYKADLKAITGKTLAQLGDDEWLQAMWVRIYDQAHNDRRHRIVEPEGAFGDFVKVGSGKDATTAWGSFGDIAKSISILKDGSPENISARLGLAHKVRSFYNNIFDPNGTKGDVTIDTHAVAAALLRPLAGADLEVSHALGAGVDSDIYGIRGTYGIYAEAYRRAAKERGILPREMQSITWEAVRGLFTPEFKAAESRAGKSGKIDAIWEQYRKGKIDEDQVREQIEREAGGIISPDWHRPGSGPTEQAWSSTYGGELSQSGISREAVGPRAGRVNPERASGTGPGDLARLADDGNPNTFYQSDQAKAPGPTFYSELSRQVDKVDMKAAPVKGWKDWIKGQVSKGGVKAEEIKWSGLEEWLDLRKADDVREEDAREEILKIAEERGPFTIRQAGEMVEVVDRNGKAIDEYEAGPEGDKAAQAFIDHMANPPKPPKIAKEEIQEFLRNNGVKVEEVMLGDRFDATDPAYLTRVNRLREAGYEIVEGDDGGEALVRIDDGGLTEPRNLRGSAREDAEWLLGMSGHPTKFSSYQLPGGENYRELLLTLPPTVNELPQWKVIRPDGHVDATYATEESARIQAGRRGDGYTVQEGETKQLEGGFRSSHFDQPNILAHVRFNDRTVPTESLKEGHPELYARLQAEGRTEAKVLHAEEFQADKAQLWRKLKGKIDDGTASAAEIEEFKMIDSMPFNKTDAWTALVIKRMIRYAAENGYDIITWTTGAQQVDRYSQALRKAVDVIEWKKTPEGVQIVGYKGKIPAHQIAFETVAEFEGDPVYAAEAGNGTYHVSHSRGFPWHWDGPGGTSNGGFSSAITAMDDAKQHAASARGTPTKVVDTTEKETDLSDSIGKSMADRIRNDPAQSGTIEGENINVSDTGMAGFYDRIVPKVANEVLKKLGGGKVQEVRLGKINGESIAADEGTEIRQAALRFMRGDISADELNEYTGLDMNYEQLDGMLQARSDNRAEQQRVASAFVRFVKERIGGQKQSTQPSIEITPAMREKALAGQPLFQPSRGQIHFGDDQTIINLFENANASTFLHETGHFFLQVTRDLAMSPNAPIKAMEHWAAIAKELKIEGGEIPREAHETFARSFEAYLREGKAPTPELQSVFKQFRDWLVQIYQSIKDLNVELSDEMRAIMDRMLTSQSRETGETRSVPSETPGSGLPPPSIGGESPAASGLSLQDAPLLAKELVDIGAKADDLTLQEADLVAKAAEVDEAAVEAAAIQYENDKAGFLIEMRRITDEKEAAQTQAPSETQGQKGGNETDRLLAQEADRYVMDNPDQLVPIGVNQDGSSIQMKASEYLAQARNEAALAREDIHLLEVAAGCLMGT